MCPTMEDGAPVYAIFADGRAHKLESSDSAPYGALVFRDYDDMGRLTTEELDRITMGLLKAQVPASRTHGEALDRAWTATLAAARAQEDAEKDLPRRKRAKIKPARVEKTYALTYDPAAPTPHIETAIRSLPPQASACLEILALGGKSSLLEREVKALMIAHAERLGTTQAPWRIFMYYRKPLRQRGFLSFSDERAQRPSITVSEEGKQLETRE